jgi:hypothetical protein
VANKLIDTGVLSAGFAPYYPPVNSDIRRHRVSARFGLLPLEPDGERLVAHLERRTAWDS